MNRHSTTLICLLLFLSFLFSCASPSRPTGYLQDYSKLEPGQNLELYWSDRDLIEKESYSGIVLAKIESRVASSGNVSGEEACDWLRSAVTANSASSDDLVLGTQSEKVASLYLAITEMTPGSAFGRIMAGELGAGHAWIQIEGRVTDDKNELLLAHFSDRRRASGAIGFRDLGGDCGPAMLREMITSIGIAVCNELRSEFNF